MENISTHLLKKDYVWKGTYNLLSQACDKINNVYYSFLNIATSHEKEMLTVLQMLTYLFKLSL